MQSRRQSDRRAYHKESLRAVALYLTARLYSWSIRIQEEIHMNLKGRNFLKLMDFTPEEILYHDRSGSRSERQRKSRVSCHDSLSRKEHRTDF